MSLAERLWAYQAERFPLKKTVPLLAVFSAASLNVSAVLSGRDLPGWGAYTLAFLLALVLFFQMRVCDEVKDSDDDRRYRPERPIPRGLVSLHLIVALGVATVPVAALAAAAYATGVLWLLLLVWFWLGLMTVEFGSPAWLKARPLLYLVSHMAIMPLIDLMLTGVEWVPGGGPSGWLWSFLALSFLNGCVLEIGRKLWAPGSERQGVETYSKLWGPERGSVIWAGTVGVSAMVLAILGFRLGHGYAFGAIAVCGFVAALVIARRYVARRDAASQALLDAGSGGWVLLCYATAGFLPLVS